MSEHEPIIYIDHSEIREGMMEELKAAMNNLVELVKAKEPQIIAYNVYFTEDGKRMTVIHIHPDSASLEFHTKVAGPAFADFVDFVKMLRIDVYGRLTDSLLEQLRKKARMLGSGVVVTHALHDGFARFEDR